MQRNLRVLLDLKFWPCWRVHLPDDLVKRKSGNWGKAIESKGIEMVLQGVEWCVRRRKLKRVKRAFWNGSYGVE